MASGKAEQGFESAEDARASRTRRKGRIDTEALRKLIRSRLDSAIAYRDEDLTPDNTKVQKYFEGDRDLDGDLPAPVNRSKFVSRDVRDTIYAVLPDLTDIFFGNDESVVEFIPVGPDDVKAARDATQYINYLVRKHGGLNFFWSVFLDALKSKVGPVRYWWDKSKVATETEYTGLPPDEFEALQLSPDETTTIEVVEKSSQQVPTEIIDELTLRPVTVMQEVIDCTIKVTTERGGVRMAAVPPEERLIDPNAKSLNPGDFTFWAHARGVPVGELVGMGYDEDVCYDLGGGDTFHSDEEAEKRENAGDRADREDDKGDPSMRIVPFAQCYVYGDLEGEGFPSLFYVCVGGSDAQILHGPERVKQANVAGFQSVPVEHVATGMAYATNVVDIQAWKTAMIRGMNDSLAQSIHPRMGIDERMVNVQDVMNDEPGAIVRCKGTPSTLVAEFGTTFTGQQVLAVLGYADEVKEARAGVSRNTAGLDPSALQSTTKVAAAAVVSGSQKQVKMLARVLAVTGFVPLFKGLLRLVHENQKTPERIRLHNGEFAEFDPREWNPDMDCIVRTALGGGSTEEKIAILDRVAAAQEKLMMSGSPLVTDINVFATMREMLGLSAYRDATMFFTPPQLGPDGKPVPRQKPESPEASPAKAEMFKAETERKSKIEANFNDRIKTLLEDDRERDSLEVKFMLELLKLAIDARQNIDIERVRGDIQAAINRDRGASELAAKAMALMVPGQEQQAAQPQGAPQQ